MSTRRVRWRGQTTVHLTCDANGCGRDYDTGMMSVRDGRFWAGEIGWAWKRQPTGFMADLCPDHAPRRERQP